MLTSLPNDKTVVSSKLKSCADDKINVTQQLKFVMEWVENIVEKGENAGSQYFLLFQKCFQKLSIFGTLKVGIMWQRDTKGAVSLTLLPRQVFTLG